MDLSGSGYRAIAARVERGNEIPSFVDCGKIISNSMNINLSDFRLPPRCKSDIHSSEVLRSVDDC
jgi:hypothetical protein